MSCPVLNGYYSRTKRTISNSLDEKLYEDVLDQWVSLLNDVAEVEPNLTTQRLRAFYCVEVLYWHFCADVLAAVDYRSSMAKLKQHRLDRSWKGLGKLLQLLDKISEDVSLNSLCIAMRGATLSNNEEGVSSFRDYAATTRRNLRRNKLDKAVELLELTKKAVSELKSELKERTTYTGRVGQMLADGVTLARKTPRLRISLAQDLLNINERNGLRPWQKVYQELPSE
jgi:hypothetical protein